MREGERKGGKGRGGGKRERLRERERKRTLLPPLAHFSRNEKMSRNPGTRLPQVHTPSLTFVFTSMTFDGSQRSQTSFAYILTLWKPHR